MIMYRMILIKNHEEVEEEDKYIVMRDYDSNDPIVYDADIGLYNCQHGQLIYNRQGHFEYDNDIDHTNFFTMKRVSDFLVREKRIDELRSEVVFDIFNIDDLKFVLRKMEFGEINEVLRKIEADFYYFRIYAIRYSYKNVSKYEEIEIFQVSHELGNVKLY